MLTNIIALLFTENNYIIMKTLLLVTNMNKYNLDS